MKVVNSSLVYAMLLLAPAWISGAAPSPEHPKLPPRFEPNLGQAPSGADFISYGDGFRLLIERGGATLQSLDGGSSGRHRLAYRRSRRGWRGPRVGAGYPGQSSYFLGNDRDKWVQRRAALRRLSNDPTSTTALTLSTAPAGRERSSTISYWLQAPTPATIALEFEGAEASPSTRTET